MSVLKERFLGLRLRNGRNLLCNLFFKMHLLPCAKSEKYGSNGFPDFYLNTEQSEFYNDLIADSLINQNQVRV